MDVMWFYMGLNGFYMGLNVFYIYIYIYIWKYYELLGLIYMVHRDYNRV